MSLMLALLCTLWGRGTLLLPCRPYTCFMDALIFSSAHTALQIKVNVSTYHAVIYMHSGHIPFCRKHKTSRLWWSSSSWSCAPVYARLDPQYLLELCQCSHTIKLQREQWRQGLQIEAVEQLLFLHLGKQEVQHFQVKHNSMPLDVLGSEWMQEVGMVVKRQWTKILSFNHIYFCQRASLQTHECLKTILFTPYFLNIISES